MLYPDFAGDQLRRSSACRLCRRREYAGQRIFQLLLEKQLIPTNARGSHTAPSVFYAHGGLCFYAAKCRAAAPRYRKRAAAPNGAAARSIQLICLYYNSFALTPCRPAGRGLGGRGSSCAIYTPCRCRKHCCRSGRGSPLPYLQPAFAADVAADILPGDEERRYQVEGKHREHEGRDDRQLP